MLARKTIKQFRSYYHRILDLAVDLLRGIETYQRVDVNDLLPIAKSHHQTLKRENLKPYHPTRYSTIRRIFDSLPFDFKNYSFVDLGSGKGRVLIEAAKWGFHECYGVEICSKLHTISQENLEKAKLSNCYLHCCDAGDFEFPAGNKVVFLFNPFAKPTLDRVSRKIIESIQPNETTWIVYVNPINEIFPQFEFCYEIQDTDVNYCTKFWRLEV